ncbi:hypothetical protein Tco_0882073 [Tanacetum coccineum]
MDPRTEVRGMSIRFAPTGWCRIEEMVAAAQNTNNTTMRSIIQHKKLNGPNFMNWYRNLRIVLRSEGKLAHLEQPLILLPLPVAPQAVCDTYEVLYDACRVDNHMKGGWGHWGNKIGKLSGPLPKLKVEKGEGKRNARHLLGFFRVKHWESLKTLEALVVGYVGAIGSLLQSVEGLSLIRGL